MPSIANQDYKIYGLLNDSPILGFPGQRCGEVSAAMSRAINSAFHQANSLDGYVLSTTGDNVCKILGFGVFFDVENGDMTNIPMNHSNNPAYYDALWAIQQAFYNYDNSILSSGMEFGIDDGMFYESATGEHMVNEDGYIIKGTAEDGKLASLYLGEKAENPDNYVVVRLESLLPLVGELPLETTEIW